jgi:transposase
MVAMVQVRRPSAGQAYYQRKLAEGKSPKEALRCLKRRLSDAVYRCLATDQAEQPAAMATGNCGPSACDTVGSHEPPAGLSCQASAGGTAHNTDARRARTW